ncbi:pro-glucagon isoform X2 [Rana temporaria]|uniref:pro-glucagon isoform X2 n=1 Tax=Rana temporaria TaxID=8407 RepID=UPI001AAD0639|nr:pro-glucagon isoform X2 [Rana temporaria]
MKSLYYMVGLLFMLLQGSLQSPIQETEDKSRSVKAARTEALDDSDQHNEVKRHSQGTFTSDYSKYLDSRRAQDFVQWLMNSKRSGGISKRNVQFERHAEGTYTNDVTQFLEEKAAKEFIDWLIKGKPKKLFPDLSAEEMDRRHADGSFTSDFNKALDIKAAQEFLDWIINTPVKERDLLEEQ